MPESTYVCGLPSISVIETELDRNTLFEIKYSSELYVHGFLY